MKKFFLRGVALVLAVCAMQCFFVPAVTATNNGQITYNFYDTVKSTGKTRLFHYSDTNTAKAYVDELFSAGNSVWKVENFANYANITNHTQGGFLTVVLSQGSYAAFRFKAPGTTGNYDVSIDYIATDATTTYKYDAEKNANVVEKRGANLSAEFMILPAKKNYTYSYAEITELIAENKPQFWGLSCYNENGYTQVSSKEEIYHFEEDQEYLLLVKGGPSHGDPKEYGLTYLRGLSFGWSDDQTDLIKDDVAFPATVVEESLHRWNDSYFMATEVNGEDFLAVPIYGGKMYIFNLDTWQLVEEVHTGIDVPRGITADDNGVLYLVGTGYSIYTYDLKTYTAGRTSKYNLTGVNFGSAYDISFGEDRKVYFGTDHGHIVQYTPYSDATDTNPNDGTFQIVFLAEQNSNTTYANEVIPVQYATHGIKNPGYVSAVVQQDGYLYAAVTTTVANGAQHYILKLNSETFDYMGKVNYTSTDPATYMGQMSITEEGIIFGSNKDFMAVDTKQITLDNENVGLLTLKDFGIASPELTNTGYPKMGVQSFVSEKIEGKYYYVGKDRFLYCYDPEASNVKLTKVSTESMRQYIDCQGKIVTLDTDGDTQKEICLLAIERPKDYPVYLINPLSTPNATVKEKKLPLYADAGAGTNVNSLTNGLTGKNELYFGGFTSEKVAVYNTQKGIITGKITAAGIQTDAIYVANDGTIYTGNYTEAQLTRLHPDSNKPEVLMTLHNSVFNQSRIHAIVGGDDKLFFGTFPYVYKHGGVLAWYDLKTNRSYVAVGENPEDVYYAKYEDTQYSYMDNNPTVPVETVKWYNEVTGEQLTGFAQWTGIVDYQGIKDVAYHNGILYAATSRAGGTNTEPVKDTSAVIIAYDVAARRIIATFDPIEQGFAGPVPAISGIEIDEAGNLWCIVSETLFTLELNANKDGFVYNERLSFDKYTYDATQDRANSDIRFYNGYVYAALERIGGLTRLNIETNEWMWLLPYANTAGQIPNSFVIGEDGNLYYLLGKALMMLTLDPTTEEWEKADAVTDLIKKAVTDAEITAARAAYDALTLREKSLVQNYKQFAQIEVNDLIERINNLPAEITLADYDNIQTLLSTYKSMSMEQQKKITNYSVLSNANRALLTAQNNTPFVVDGKYYLTAEEAMDAAAEGGKILLQNDVTVHELHLKSGVVLDLNGNTLTADSVSGKVIDSKDGRGLVNVSACDRAVLEPCEQLILWDNGASGYRIFTYTFEQKGIDANKTDATQPTVTKSFWSELCFNNRNAYKLIASGRSGLKVGFGVSWTPDGGTSVSNSCEVDSNVVAQWGEVEALDTSNTNEYYFYISITGFKKLNDSGTLSITPVIQDAFSNATTAENMEYYHKRSIQNVMNVLGFKIGYGSLPEGLS